jgi:hypothetical protein
MTHQAPVRWLHRWPPKGPATIRIGRIGDQLIVEWPGVATLRSNESGTQSDFFAASGHDASARMQGRLRAHVAAMLGHLRGDVTLHASSVARSGIAIAFVGDSGVGKSTIARQLCADPHVELLSDDAAALRFDRGYVEVIPSEKDHWLRPDVARAMGLEPIDELKTPQRAAQPAKTSARLAVVVSLVFDGHYTTPALRPIRGVDAFSVLGTSTFRFALDVPDVLRKELDRYSQIVDQARFFELRRSRDLACVGASIRPLTDLLDNMTQGLWG